MSESSIQDNSAIEYIKSLTLLCVDDNKTTQQLYSMMLEDITENIIFANNGNDGYTKFMEEEIDIILTDYDMPECNGLEMSKKIRDINKNIPIIFISAIKDIDIIEKALELQVNKFVKKPIDNTDIINALNDASKSIIANNYIEKQKKDEIELLQKKNSYNSYQEDLAFAKELNILRNDFYYQMIDEAHVSLVDFLYQPLDVISGDAYTARRIDGHRTFYLIVDGMGKGLSASLTAMIMTSFINHIIDKMIEYESFSIDILLKESLDYIKPILLDEEAVAVDYILFDTAYDNIQYAKFAMPVMLMQDKNQNIIKLKSNNPPLSKWQDSYKIDEYNISNIDKFLFYSDGVAENSTLEKNKTYADFIDEDFASSFTREDLKTKIFNKIDTPEDDITLIFINRLPLDNNLVQEKQFETSLENIDLANAWYEKLWETFTDDTTIAYKANVVFTELYMNAYEHGNLGIDSALKHKLLDEDIYFEELTSKSLACEKRITVKVNKLLYEFTAYIITQVIDEGEGFDTQILSEIFRNSATFNGRGVFVSRKNSLGIYYSSKGNSVLYLNKI